MICYVDIEHERWLASPESRTSHLASCMDVKLKLEEISGSPCLVQRYGDVTRQRLRALGVSAVILSGNAVGFGEYRNDAFAELYSIIREGEWPLLGLCGGHQLIAMAHGADVGPMRRLRPGEPEITTLSGPGYVKEWGFKSVNVLQSDPIFEGLGPSPVFLEAHYWQVKQVPPGFQVLAATDDCPIQAMKRSDRPVYGTQFHAEAYTEGAYDRRSPLVSLIYPDGQAQSRPDGRTLLANFCRVAGILK